LNQRNSTLQELRTCLGNDSGAATAEYAIATMAAVGFAGLLVIIMRSDEVKEILLDLVRSALTFTNPNDAPAD